MIYAITFIQTHKILDYKIHIIICGALDVAYRNISTVPLTQ